MKAAPVLAIEELRVDFDQGDRTVHAVRGVSLTVAPGEVVGLVGESGSGKSVMALSATRLLDESRARIRAARLDVDGKAVRELSARQLESLRGPIVSYVFQDPQSSLNPVLTIGRQIAEGLRRHRRFAPADARRESVALMRQVGIPDPELRRRQFPHQLSGGMRQRVMIAMALALQPKLLIADEPTTALDVTVQAEIVHLIKSIQADSGMAMIWVTHDLALLARIAGRIVVMYAGRIVEDAPSSELYASPAHPYTLGLLASTSRFDRSFRDQEPIPGAPPDPTEPLPGCAFAPRCAHAGAVCRERAPSLQPLSERRSVACFHPRTSGAT